MKGVLNPEALAPLPNVASWLHHAQPARRAAEKSVVESTAPEFLVTLTEFNVIEQLKNLRTHPAVAASLREGSVRLHGWVYHIGRGTVTAYNPKSKKFSPIRTAKTKSVKKRRKA